MPATESRAPEETMLRHVLKEAFLNGENLDDALDIATTPRRPSPHEATPDSDGQAIPLEPQPEIRQSPPEADILGQLPSPHDICAETNSMRGPPTTPVQPAVQLADSVDSSDDVHHSMDREFPGTRTTQSLGWTARAASSVPSLTPRTPRTPGEGHTSTPRRSRLSLVPSPREPADPGVVAWLKANKLSAYIPVFEAHEVDLEVLPTLTYVDLLEMRLPPHVCKAVKVRAPDRWRTRLIVSAADIQQRSART